MFTYEIELTNGETITVEHVIRVELSGENFYFILKGSHKTFNKDVVKGFGATYSED